MTDALRYDGRVVIVTGAGNGLGRSHALMFGARGAKVVVNDLGGGIHGDGKSSLAADKVVEEIKALGGEAVANYDSVTDGDKIVQTALDAFGGIDIVVNNAGILRDTSFQKLSEQDWELIYRVHLYGGFKVTHAAWPHMRVRGYGRVIMTTSAAGIYGNFGQANYSAAKLGLVGLASTLAAEGRNKGIHVNTVAPIAGSRLTETVLPPELIAALKPEFVSPLVAWLCHESCTETNGLFEAGAGYIGKLRWERTRGHSFKVGRAFGPEDVKKYWDAIADFKDAEHPASVAESMAPLLSNIQKKSLGGNDMIDLDAASGDQLVAESSYDERDLALYALGIGAARDALDPSELKFTYELGDGFQALPSYAVIPALSCYMNLARDGKSLKGLNYGLDRILHGEQYTEILRPLPRRAKLTHTYKFKTAYDKAPHAVVILTVDTTDESGEKLAYNEISMFVRGAGGWGGERGPSADINVPPAREPDAVIEEKTDPNQTLLYRLSGDWNPLHADPAFAKAFGFDKPILHGLCTFGYASRHVVKAFCGNDVRKWKSIKVRFADSVFPGESLITRMWKESDTRVVFETKVKERDKVVLRNAAVELYREVPKPKAAPAPVAAEAKQSAPAASIQPSAADVFGAIGKHIAANTGLVAQLNTVFQFKLKDPASDWVLDMKSGDGSVTAGSADKPDVTLELSDADFLDMCMGKVDPNKLYFSGKLKISGNIMASQKLTFLQKIDPALIGSSAPASASSKPAAQAKAPAASKGRSGEIFATLAERVGKSGQIAKGVNAVLRFNISDPDAGFNLDFKAGAAKIAEGPVVGVAEATFGIADQDLVALVKGEVDVQELYQRGKLRVDGDVRLARKLSFLNNLI